MQKKDKQKLIIGIVIMLMLVIGATYAYFSMEGINNTTSTNINSRFGVINVSLRKVTPNLHIKLSNSDMSIEKEGTSYYGTDDENKNYDETRVERTIARMEVVDEGEYEYTCTYDLEIEVANNIKEELKEKEIVLYISGDNNEKEIDISKYSNAIKITHELNNENRIKEIKGVIELKNKSEDQSHLIGKEIEIEIKTRNVECGKKYSIEYNLNGGNLPSTAKMTYKDTDEEYILPTPEREGYEFDGWYESSTYEGNKITSIPKGSVGNKKYFAKWIDTIYPTLNLSKYTYITSNFNDWTITGATVSNGVLTINNVSDTATSNYINVNGGKWWPIFDGYVENTCSAYSPKGGIGWDSYYYDSNYNSANSLQNYTSNGWAVILDLNTWTNDVDWYKRNNYTFDNMPRYGPNVKYIRLKFGNDRIWNSTPPIKIRNLKIYGEAIPNNFYFIKIDSSDNNGVVTTKYAKGTQNSVYFRSNGTIVNGNEIRVTENGIYTVYVSDEYGNETLQTININNIVN